MVRKCQTEENVICETLSNALITVEFNEGLHEKPLQLNAFSVASLLCACHGSCFMEESGYSAWLRFSLIGREAAQGSLWIHQTAPSSLFLLLSVCSARRDEWKGGCSYKIEEKQQLLAWIFPVTPQCAAADRLILRYESIGLLFFTGRSLKLDVLHECLAVKLKKDLRWC